MLAPIRFVFQNTAKVVRTASKVMLGATFDMEEPLHKKNEQKHIFSTVSPYEWVSHSLKNTLSLVEQPRPVTIPSGTKGEKS